MACHVSAMNTTAVRLLQENRNYEAVDCTGKGLERMKQTSEWVSDPMTTTATTDFHLYTVHLPPVSHFERAFTPNSSFMIFNKAFALRANAATNSKMSSTDQSIAQVVYLYNMALASHREGIQTANLKALRHALRVYRVVFTNIIQDLDMNSNRLSVLILAVMNNIGQLEATFSNFSKVNYWRSKMTKYARHILCSDVANCAEEDLSFFSSNLVSSATDTCKPAPAA